MSNISKSGEEKKHDLLQIKESLEDLIGELEDRIRWHNQQHSGQHLWSVEKQITACYFVLDRLKYKCLSCDAVASLFREDKP